MATNERDVMQARLQGFMDLNYPCECEPDDPNCSKNHYEVDHMIDLVAVSVLGFIEGLPSDADRDMVIEALKKSMFIPKEITTYER